MPGMSELVNEELVKENERLRIELARVKGQVKSLDQDVINRLERMERRLARIEESQTPTTTIANPEFDTWGNSPVYRDEMRDYYKLREQLREDTSGKKYVDARIKGLEKISPKKRY